MIVKKKKLIIVLSALILLFLLSVQIVKSNTLLKEKEMLQAEISKQEEKNYFLKNKYNQTKKIKNSRVKTKNVGLKENTAEILTEIKKIDLKLIDLSSTENELNLNLSGDFHSILHFINYLESETAALKIEEFKIKKNDYDLFLFLKLKKELI